MYRRHIEPVLETGCGLPKAYTPELYQGQVAAGFPHVFESYQGKDQERKDHPSGKVKT